MKDLLDEQLTLLHTQNRPETEFAELLEQELRMIHIAQFQHETGIRRNSARALFSYLRIAGIAAALIIVLSLFTVPSLRGLAQEFLVSLFARAESNTVTVPQPEEAPINAEPSFLSLEEAQSLVDFEIKTPGYPLTAYQFMGVGYSSTRHGVNLVYTSPGRFLTITQQPLEFAEQGLLTDSTLGIGRDAPIIEVMIGDIQGVFVTGAWVETATSSEVQWMPSAPRRRLRWIQDGMLYEILAEGGSEGHSSIGQDDMVDIALSLG